MLVQPGTLSWKVTWFAALVLVAAQAGPRSAQADDSTSARQSGASRCALSVLSLNLHGARDSRIMLSALQKAGAFERADLMLFQEVVHPSEGADSAVEQFARGLGMHVTFAPGFRLRNGEQEGLAVLSRYPIVESRVIPLRHYNLRWKSRRRIALAVTVEAPAGRVLVYNLHLDTRVNLKARLEQLRPIAEEAAEQRVPVLLGGDLNTNPYRWVEHTLPLPVGSNQGTGLLKFMEGLGFASAFPPKLPTSDFLRMRLDWIFLRNMEAGRIAIRPISFSDHHALYACMQPSTWRRVVQVCD